MKRKTNRRSSRSSEEKGLFNILEKDHRNVKKLFQQVLSGRQRNDEIFKRIKNELDVHMLAEERHLYPELENDDRTREMILESYEEHNLGKELNQRLESDSFDDEHWIAKLKVLSDVIDHHIEEEEGMMFPKAKKVLDKDEQQRIADSIMEEKNSSDELVTEGEEPEEENMQQGNQGPQDTQEEGEIELGEESDEIKNRKRRRLKEQ